MIRLSNLACALTLASLASAPVQAITGPEVARLLNFQYRDQASACAAQFASFQCSGVLIKPLPADHPQAFWEHGATAIALGAESLAYLRADVGIRATGQPSGFVLASGFTAISLGKPYEVLCSYPLAFPLTADRPAAGCGTSQASRQDPDPASCAAAGVVDAAGWWAHFAGQGSDPQRQCSFSARDASAFLASLQAHAQGEATQLNLVQVRNWQAGAPGALAVQALYYDADLDQHDPAAAPLALAAAQRDQRDYHAATGEWLPILRLRLGDTHPFGFDLTDQLYVGYQVAARLEARYLDTAATCRDHSAAYRCNGVLLRSAEATTSFHAWDPSPNSIRYNGVSFSYVRADVGTLNLVFNRPHGFLFRELAAPVAHPVELRCAYPFDAGTAAAPTDACTLHQRCEDLQVDSVQAWSARYANNFHASCAFAPGAETFQLSIQVREAKPNNRNEWNEIMIATWPQGIPAQLPLEAFFFQKGSNGLAGGAVHAA